MCAFPFVYAHPGPPEPHISSTSRNVRLTRSASPAHFQTCWKCVCILVVLICTASNTHFQTCWKCVFAPVYAHTVRHTRTFPASLEMCGLHGPLHLHISRDAGNVRLTMSVSPAHFQRCWKCAAYMVRLTHTFPASLEMCGLHGPPDPHISRDAGNVWLTWSASSAHFRHLWKCVVYMVHLTRTFPASQEMCDLHGPPHLHISRDAGNVWLTWFASPAHFRHLCKCVIYIHGLPHLHISCPFANVPSTHIYYFLLECPLHSQYIKLHCQPLYMLCNTLSIIPTAFIISSQPFPTCSILVSL